MKKQNRPVLLITVVVAVLLGMVVVNMTGMLNRPGGLQEIKSPDKEALLEARERQQASTEDRIKTMKERSLIASIGPDGPKANLKEGIPETPSIAMPKGEAPQAKFETDRTSSHWYDDQSKQSEEAKKGGN
jgi:hypothetical protein